MEYRLLGKNMEIALKDIGLENTQAFFDIFIPSRKWQHLLIQN